MILDQRKVEHFLSVAQELGSAQPLYDVHVSPYEWTWSLGPEWMARFQCVDLRLVDVGNRDWGPYPIDAVTGATFTSQAIIESVWQALGDYELVFP